MHKRLLKATLPIAGLLAGQWMYGAESTARPEVSQTEVRGIGDIRVELRTYGEGEQQRRESRTERNAGFRSTRP